MTTTWGCAVQGMGTADPAAALLASAAAGRLSSLVGATSPLRPILEEAGRRYRGPLRIEVGGRPGVGRDTMARAVRERLSPMHAFIADPARPEDTDIWLYVLPGPPRAADRDAIAALPADRRIVVLGRADTHGEWAVAQEVAAEAAHRLGLPVLPVSALLACAEVTADEMATLGCWARSGLVMPSMVGQFLAVPTESAEYRTRVAMLRHLDQYGIDLALTLLADADPDDPVPLDAPTLTRVLRRASGIGALAAPITACEPAARYWRGVELRGALEDAAAADVDRDRAESLLSGSR
ncbi:hypothetical protein QSJ18_00195 [Gordonia sp. ABSL1-1]|uniref:hypothetical protein n=1 Tax=Gordonia sp. ABSL1-1 TaxID=3053923 RepID=UPI00257303D2|nr:hypothetical protein [Gordonia sp. ABSL1-1]MDL9935156.1 hypothetical protein [Gordonia sp. ABSL1-1]